MNKQNILLVLDKVSYVLLINATIFVVLFQFLAGSILLYVAMISYALAFLMIAALCGFRIYLDFIKEENQTFELSRKKKIWLILKLILSFVLFGLSLVVALLW